ncbi:MAG: LapA family protein [Spirochaetes bacterium]|nr:LapA family protein [Spirochaetota bacterium]MBU0954956.1 LapA family protein [Spirochaetota bacterium]
MKILYILLMLAVMILAVVFALQNSMEVTVQFFGWSAAGSLSLVLMLALFGGVLFGVVIMLPSVLKHSVQFTGLRRRFKRLEKEKDKLTSNADPGNASVPPAELPEGEGKAEGKAKGKAKAGSASEASADAGGPST